MSKHSPYKSRAPNKFKYKFVWLHVLKLTMFDHVISFLFLCLIMWSLFFSYVCSCDLSSILMLKCMDPMSTLVRSGLKGLAWSKLGPIKVWAEDFKKAIFLYPTLPGLTWKRFGTGLSCKPDQGLVNTALYIIYSLFILYVFEDIFLSYL